MNVGLAVPDESPPKHNEIPTMCSYTGSVLTPTSACQTACEGCLWSATVTSVKEGTSCKFTYTVTRSNCTYSTDATFRSTVTVPCDESTIITFSCSGGSGCMGYSLTFTADPCPIPPGG
jgi:hypothetical protein